MNQVEEACQDLYKLQATEFLPILTALTPLLSRVENQVVHDERGYGLKLSGFYKDGSITVRPGRGYGMISDAPVATVDGRYEELLEIYDGGDIFKSIAQLNARRFTYWNSVKPEFDKIDSQWLPILIEAGLVEPIVHTTYKVR